MEGARLPLALFALHMLLNWAWSPLFFMAQAVLAAWLLILLLIFTAAMLLWLIWPIDRPAALVFLPYILWLVFAGHLSHFILLNN
jgi:tryptophan-rich sensory protein